MNGEPYNDANWREDAECKKFDPEIFFPEGDPKVTRRAQKICGGCAVKFFCLEYALRTNTRYGVWGGMNMTDRVLAAKLKRRIIPEPRD